MSSWFYQLFIVFFLATSLVTPIQANDDTQFSVSDTPYLRGDITWHPICFKDESSRCIVDFPAEPSFTVNDNGSYEAIAYFQGNCYSLSISELEDLPKTLRSAMERIYEDLKEEWKKEGKIKVHVIDSSKMKGILFALEVRRELKDHREISRLYYSKHGQLYVISASGDNHLEMHFFDTFHIE